MEAVVLGGGGLTGRCAVRDLARGRVFERIRVADLDAGLADRAAKAATGTPVESLPLDVRHAPALRDTLRGASVCVNAVQYTFNVEIMAACLAEGVPYLDFGGLFHVTRKQLEWDAKFRERNLLAIPGMGQVPGVSNVLAFEACRDLDRVDSIVIRDGWTDRTVNGPEILFTWSPSTFLDEMQMPAVVYEEGQHVEHPPMSGAEWYEFAPPVGRTRVYRTLHSEPATLPESLKEKGISHCEWKEGGPGIDLLRTMALLGLGSDKAVDVRGSPVVPREFLLALLRRENLLGVPAGVRIDDWEVCDIEVRGTLHGSPAERHALARFPPKPEWELTATEYAVGVCGAISAEMIARREITATGVVPPERCVPAARFRAELAARGIPTAIAPPEAGLPEWLPADL